MLTVQRVRGGARKALLQRRVVQLGSLTARRDRLLEPDAMAAMPTREGAKRSGPSRETQLLGGGGPPAHFVRPRKKARSYVGHRSRVQEDNEQEIDEMLQDFAEEDTDDSNDKDYEDMRVNA